MGGGARGVIESQDSGLIPPEAELSGRYYVGKKTAKSLQILLMRVRNVEQ